MAKPFSSQGDTDTEKYFEGFGRNLSKKIGFFVFTTELHSSRHGTCPIISEMHFPLIMSALR